jgi:hypothetical protein
MQLGANVSLMPPNVGVNKVFSDPAYQMMAQRMGMDPRTYWQALQPQAQAQHLKRVNAGPPIYTTEDQIHFGNRIGANSGLAAIPEDAPTGSYPPVSAGYEGAPKQPSAPALGTPSGILAPSAETAVTAPGHQAILNSLSPDALPDGGPTYTKPVIQSPHALDQMEAEGTLPLLSNSGTTNQPGALTDSGTAASSVASRNAAATSGNRGTPTNNTGNARGSGVPDLSVNKGDMWIRMGSAMLANSQNGLANSLGAAGQAYSDVQDENKVYALKKYEMEQAKIAADRANAARSGGSANIMTTQEANSEVARMDEAIAALTSGGVTGPFEGGSLGQWWDRSGFGNTADAAMRLILSDYAVNKQLAFTSQTKGAISDREMALFEKPIPKLTDSEEVWLAWFKPQRAVLAQLASQGYTVESLLGQQGQADTSGYTIQELPAE